MDKLPDDVTHRINKAVKSMGDGATSIINSVSYLRLHLNSNLFLYNGAFLPDIYAKDHEKFIPAIGKFFKGERKFLL